jgi:Undecaprenyl-phosphate galactose phosphotransferase WbaP
MSIEMPGRTVVVTQPVTRTSLQTRAVPQGLALIGGDILSGLVAHAVIGMVFLFFGGPRVSWKVTAAWLVLWLFWRAYQGLYPGYGQSPQTELRRHTVSTVQVAVAQLAAALAVQRFAPSGITVLVEWLVILLIALPIRYGVRSAMIHFKMYGRPVSIIGAGETAKTIVEHLLAHPGYGLVPIAAYDDNSCLHGQSIHGVDVVGDIALALNFPKTEQAIIGIPSARADTQKSLTNNVYAVFPITWTVPDLVGVPNQAMQPHSIGALASLEIRNNLRSARAQIIKRATDIFATVVGGMLISPLLLIIAVAIRLDSPGPVFYPARRLGRDGEPFNCFKFRSMHRDAEFKLRSMLDADPELEQEFQDTHKLKNDPRVTRVGNFLRKTSLDELPQLANVLMGTMSLVGPRPIVHAEIERYGSVYTVYKQVRPGMTGYWQANGRSDTTYDERVGMDNFYVTNWTPWLDLVILIQTVRVVVVGRGAY